MSTENVNPIPLNTETESATRMIAAFQRQFHSKYKTKLKITYDTTKIPVIPELEDLTEDLNTILEAAYDPDRKKFPKGILTRKRSEILVAFRAIFFLISRSYGYFYHEIARYCGITHATVIHGIKSYDNMYKSNHQSLQTTYSLIINNLDKNEYSDFLSKNISK